MSSLPSIFAAVFIPRLPAMIVWLAGLIIALATWKRHPQVSLLAVVALALFFANAIAGAWLTARAPFVASGPTRAGLILGLGNALLGLVYAGGWVVMLVAVFGWRRGGA